LRIADNDKDGAEGFIFFQSSARLGKEVIDIGIEFILQVDIGRTFFEFF
jgi:hypothetical protein